MLRFLASRGGPAEEAATNLLLTAVGSSYSICLPKLIPLGKTEAAQHSHTFLKVNFPLCS